MVARWRPNRWPCNSYLWRSYRTASFLRNMKTLVAAFTLAMITGTAAQTPMPSTVPLVNNTTKETVGTATFSGNSIYLRDIKGELYAIATNSATAPRRSAIPTARFSTRFPANRNDKSTLAAG